jgi:hypothetical protein
VSAAPHLSSLRLDELALGTLSPGEAAQAQAHLGSCAQCKADFDALAADRAQFTAAVLPKTMGAVRRRAEGLRARPRRSWFAGLAVAMGAAAAVVIAVRRPSLDSDLLAKGDGPSVSAFFKRGDRVAPAAGQRLRRGDSVRLTVVAKENRFLAVYSIDGTGLVTRWFPQAGEQSGEVAAHARTELPGSIVLDASPGPERLYAWFTPVPLPLAPLERELRATGKVDVPGAEVVTLQLDKEVP